jgi:modification methylase
MDIIEDYVKLARDRLKEEGLHIRPNALIANWRKIPSHFVHR